MSLVEAVLEVLFLAAIVLGFVGMLLAGHHVVKWRRYEDSERQERERIYKQGGEGG